MSSHFNYEIEERNMRKQLKELEVSYKEEAWLNYEVYAKQFHIDHKSHLIPNFNFSLNRTVILPVIFGGIIVLFSFLLFNFINIKNTSSPKTEISEVKSVVLPGKIVKQLPTPKKEIVAVIVKEDTAKLESAIITNSAIIVPVTNTIDVVAKVGSVPSASLVANKSIAANTVSQNIQITNAAPTFTFEPKKKKRKKGKAEVLESIATPISLPTVTQEETEPELK